MNHLLALLAGLLISAPLVGATFVGNTLTLDEVDAAKCKAGGGCQLITRQQIRALEDLDRSGKT